MSEAQATQLAEPPYGVFACFYVWVTDLRADRCLRADRPAVRDWLMPPRDR
jgi:hypothetical protein